MNKAVILAGASGVGKTSVAMRLLERKSSFSFVRSATTRAPRGDEHDAEYIYLSRRDFEEKIKRGEFLEHMEYGKNLYGTPKSELERIFAEGKTPLLILDIEGVKSIRRGSYDFLVTAFYIYAELDIVERRLYERELCRGSTPERLEAFNRRRDANRRDYEMMGEIKHLFDAFIDNGRDIDNAVDQILNILE